MPELPEVETMVRGLRPALGGRRIVEASVLDPFLLHNISADDFQSRVSGAKVAIVREIGVTL